MALTTPPSPDNANQNNPMEGQVKAIAIVNFVFAALDILLALILLIGFGIGATAVHANESYGAPRWVANMLASLGLIFGLLLIALGLLHVFAGQRLLSLKRSGKSLGIFAAVLLLVFSIPAAFGGIGLIGLGAAIWMLVVLTRSDTDRLLVN